MSSLQDFFSIPAVLGVMKYSISQLRIMTDVNTFIEYGNWLPWALGVICILVVNAQ